MNSITEIAEVIGALPKPGQWTASAIPAAEVVIGIPTYGDLLSNNDERGLWRLGDKNAAQEMSDLRLKVRAAPRGLHGWA